MRVISQNGFYDLPYENVAVSLNANNRNQVIAWSSSDFGRDDLYSVMGDYSTEAKAQKAMEMLHENYKYYAKATNRSSFFTMFDNPKVFRFPADEDVKV